MWKYWLRIIGGALAIFVVGFGILRVGRRVERTIESDEDLTIPLPFVPFRLDAREVGTFRNVTLRRDAPHSISGVVLRVRLRDSAAYTSLADCRLTVDDPTHLNEQTTFRCLASDSGLIEFGSVRLELRNGESSRALLLPLLLDSAVVERIRRRGAADSVAEAVRSKAEGQRRAGNGGRGGAGGAGEASPEPAAKAGAPVPARPEH